MGRAQEPGGDYEYDLAHDDVQAESRRNAPQPGDLPTSAGSGRNPAGDSTGDYGYDEAHDF
jgi:hypothetical protein